MMKYLTPISSLVLMLVVTACGLETKTLSQFYPEDLDDVTKISIVDGNTGEKKVVEERSRIDGFIGEVKDVQFIPDENQEDRSGFSYSIAFYEEGKETFEFALNHVNGNYYHTKPDLKPVVDEFYDQIEVEKE